MRLQFWAFAAVVGPLAWTACTAAGPPVAATRVRPGQEFSLPVGASAQTVDAAVEVGFQGVGSDSRCPKGTQCIRAGDAAVRLWLRVGAAGARQTHELRLGPPPAPSVRAGAYDLHLLRLDPYPTAASSPGLADYVVTLTLRPAASAAAQDR